MAGAGLVAVAAVAFVGTHFLLSHPLRRPLVAAWAYQAAPPSAPLWPVGNVLWAVVTAMMLLASVLLMGSVVRNPALPSGGTAPLSQKVPVASSPSRATR